MFKLIWKLGLLFMIVAALYFFRFNFEDGELVIRLRSSGDRQEMTDKAKEAAEKARELAGKVRFEGAGNKVEKAGKAVKNSKKLSKIADKVNENLDEKDRKALQDMIAKELE